MAVAVGLMAGALISTAPTTGPGVKVTFVWDMPASPPPFGCDNQAYALNNPDKCGLPGPFLLGGGAPKGGGLLGAIGGLLGGLTGGLL